MPFDNQPLGLRAEACRKEVYLPKDKIKGVGGNTHPIDLSLFAPLTGVYKPLDPSNCQGVCQVSKDTLFLKLSN